MVLGNTYFYPTHSVQISAQALVAPHTERQTLTVAHRLAETVAFSNRAAQTIMVAHILAQESMASEAVYIPAPSVAADYRSADALKAVNTLLSMNRL